MPTLEFDEQSFVVRSLSEESPGVVVGLIPHADDPAGHLVIDPGGSHDLHYAPSIETTAACTPLTALAIVDVAAAFGRRNVAQLAQSFMWMDCAAFALTQHAFIEGTAAACAARWSDAQLDAASAQVTAAWERAWSTADQRAGRPDACGCPACCADLVNGESARAQAEAQRSRMTPIVSLDLGRISLADMQAHRSTPPQQWSPTGPPPVVPPRTDAPPARRRWWGRSR